MAPAEAITAAVQVAVVRISLAVAWLTAAANAWAEISAAVCRDLEMQRPARIVALGGLLAALSWLTILLALVIPTGRLFLLTLASFIVMVAWAELSPGHAVALWIAVSALGMLYPGLFPTIFYLIFFGLAPLISLFLWRRLQGLALWLIRHAIFTSMFVAAFLLVGLEKIIQTPEGMSPVLVWLVILIFSQAFFIAYEYLLRTFSKLWIDRIRPGTSFR